MLFKHSTPPTSPGYGFVTRSRTAVATSKVLGLLSKPFAPFAKKAHHSTDPSWIPERQDDFFSIISGGSTESTGTFGSTSTIQTPVTPGPSTQAGSSQTPSTQIQTHTAQASVTQAPVVHAPATQIPAQTAVATPTTPNSAWTRITESVKGIKLYRVHTRDSFDLPKYAKYTRFNPLPHVKEWTNGVKVAYERQRPGWTLNGENSVNSMGTRYGPRYTRPQRIYRYFKYPEDRPQYTSTYRYPVRGRGSKGRKRNVPKRRLMAPARYRDPKHPRYVPGVYPIRQRK